MFKYLETCPRSSKQTTASKTKAVKDSQEENDGEKKPMLFDPSQLQIFKVSIPSAKQKDLESKLK